MDDRGLWQEAQDRVLLYLKQLGLPAILSLDIARQALARAAEEAAGAGAGPPAERPVALAMRAVHLMLQGDGRLLEDTPYAGYPILYRRWHPAQPGQPGEPGPGLQPSAMPPINRGLMNIRKI